MSNTKTTPLGRNTHVRELLSILRENGKDASNLTALLKYVGSMEKQLNTATSELVSMRQELREMREERSHPVRTALQNAANSLEAKISETRGRLDALKTRIIEGCKNTVAAFKQKGISALNGIAKFFRLKPAFESLRSGLQNDIKHNEAVIAKIQAVGEKYHTAGMHLKNAGRALRGKEAVDAVKPNGKLARLATAPFRTELKCLTSAMHDAEKAVAALERLESRAAPKKEAAAERADAPADRADERPSVRETMKRLKVKIAEEKKDAPVVAKSKHIGAEI